MLWLLGAAYSTVLPWVVASNLPIPLAKGRVVEKYRRVPFAPCTNLGSKAPFAANSGPKSLILDLFKITADVVLVALPIRKESPISSPVPVAGWRSIIRESKLVVRLPVILALELPDMVILLLFARVKAALPLKLKEPFNTKSPLNSVLVPLLFAPKKLTEPPGLTTNLSPNVFSPAFCISCSTPSTRVLPTTVKFELGIETIPVLKIVRPPTEPVASDTRCKTTMSADAAVGTWLLDHVLAFVQAPFCTLCTNPKAWKAEDAPMVKSPFKKVLLLSRLIVFAVLLMVAVASGAVHPVAPKRAAWFRAASVVVAGTSASAY